jgi:hypothetical protein
MTDRNDDQEDFTIPTSKGALTESQALDSDLDIIPKLYSASNISNFKQTLNLQSSPWTHRKNGLQAASTCVFHSTSMTRVTRDFHRPPLYALPCRQKSVNISVLASSTKKPDTKQQHTLGCSRGAQRCPFRVSLGWGLWALAVYVV